MSGSSEIPPLLEMAKKFLSSEDVAKKPGKLQLASLIIELKKQTQALKGKKDYEIVKLLAKQFDALEKGEQAAHRNLIQSIKAWSGLQSADTETRRIVEVAAKQLNLPGASKLPSFIIRIHERFKTISMAFDGLPEEARKKPLNDLLDCEKQICTILTMRQKKDPSADREKNETWVEWQRRKCTIERDKISDLLQHHLLVSTKLADEMVSSLYSEIIEFIIKPK
jgi:hypothetical protein